MRKKSVRKTISQQVVEEVSKRAHDVQGQGGRVYMVLIRLDEIERIVKTMRRRK